ncbi:MAG: hypothetical protein GY696_24200, partial [Gammaproteobacteria bacterium]|nr:hypothetical protein [Gammaproteobacteria bacterium]
MNLREWVTNSPEILEAVPGFDITTGTTTKVLGLHWNLETDILQVSGCSKISACDTKRDVLQNIASVFDPLGFCIPVVLTAKLFLQQLWKKSLQ